jgi:hypothetical protein
MSIYLLQYIDDDNFLIIEKNIINDENNNNDNDEFIMVTDNNNSKNNIENIKSISKFACIFDYTKYLNDILKTYRYDWDNIYKQFKVDFDRCKVSINNVQFTDINMFVPQDQMYDITVHTLMIMLFNQSTLGFPMECIINYHNLYHDEHLVDAANSSIYINMNDISDGMTEITIFKRLKIIKTGDDIIDKYYVDIHMNFLFKNSKSYVNLKNINGIVDKYNILYWIFIPIV